MVCIYAFDDYEFDPNKLELTRGGKPSPVNTLQLRLLSVLLQSPGQMVTKQELLDSVWDGRAVSDNVVTVAIARLRKALGHRALEREVVVNVHGRGYRFVREVVRREATLPPTALPPSISDPLVGRETVLNHLRAGLNEAKQGNGGVFLLSGEAGIGKTRLAEVFAREASGQGLVVGWGSCREAGDTPPLWPIAELLREILRQADLELSDPRLAAHAPQLIRLLPDLSPDQSAPAAPSGKGHKHQIFDAIARTLAVVAENAPCVLVLDDLHRADPASLELLNYMIDEIRRTRLFVLAALRNEAAPSSDSLSRVLGHRNATRIALPRLNEAQVGSYLEAVLGASGSALHRAVFKHCEGNPFFMTELARQLRLSDERDPERVRVPDVALDIVHERLARLDPQTRHVLSCAAVIGRDFRLPILQAVSGMDAPRLMLHLDAAIAAAVVHKKTHLLTEFVFGHELLRAVLYDALSPAERRERHLQVARALEQRVKYETIAPADLAYHSRSALPLGELRKTVGYCVDACRAAAHVFAYADAARYLAHAVEAFDICDKPSPRYRMQLLFHQALLTRAQSTHAFQPLIASVVRLAREQGDGDLLARAAMLYDPYPGFPPLPGALSTFQDALGVLERAGGEPVLRAAMLARLAASPPLAFDAAAGAAQLERAAQLAQSSPEMLDLFSVRVARLYLIGGPAQRPTSRALLHELQEMCREHATTLSVPPVMLELHRALSALQEGDLGAMHAALERGTSRSRELDSELLWQFERFGVIARINAGEGVEAGRALKLLHAQARQRRIFGTELFCAYDEAVLFGTSALQDPQLPDQLAHSDGDRPNIWALKLRGLQAAGQHADALAALRLISPEHLARLPNDRDYLGTLGGLARAASELRALDYAEALYALLAPYAGQFAAHVSFVCEGAVSQLLGMLARALGRRPESDAHLRDAIHESQSAGLRACEQNARQALERHA